MMLEIDEETRDFVTIYRKDYYPKRVKKRQKYGPSTDYNLSLNPLSGPFHEPLYSADKHELITADKRRDNIRENLKKIRSMYPRLRKILPETLSDEEMMKMEQKRAFTTVYQSDYLKDLDDYLSLYARRAGRTIRTVKLPDGWVLPETIYQSFKNPRDLSKFAGLSVERKIMKPEHNLKISKDRTIATGSSEYADVIGTTGDRILKEQLHGVPIPFESPSSPLKGPDAISSECLNLLMKRKTPFISNVF